MTIGLYIHIPFCRKKCNYCDFYSVGGADSVPAEYIAALKREITAHQPFACATVYFGGGTPSLLSPQQVSEILSWLDIVPGAEITLEANPDTLSYEKLAGFRSAGVNRLSIGVQTVYNSSLQTLGRIHDADKAALAFKNAKAAGFENISGDLMIGLDNYSYDEMFATIDFLKEAGATHISAYMLKIEEGTPFYYDTPKNLADEEQMADYYLAACKRLADYGYSQYEISNFCLPDYHSRHNTIYWKLEDYLGIGPGAHSCMAGQRFYYPRDLKTFIAEGKTVADGTVDADDYIMLSLRLASGLNFETLKEKWSLVPNDYVKRKLEIYKNGGFIEYDGTTVSLTPQGFLAENIIASDIMGNVTEI